MEDEVQRALAGIDKETGIPRDTKRPADGRNNDITND
jgi:hypothetical protein